MHHDELDHLERVPSYVARCVGHDGATITYAINKRCPDHRWRDLSSEARSMAQSARIEHYTVDEDDEESQDALDAIEHAASNLAAAIFRLLESDTVRSRKWQEEESNG